MLRRLALAAALVLALVSSSGAQNQGAAANHLGTSRGSVPQLKTVVATETFADEDLVIAAVTGKRIAVVGFSLFNTSTTAGVFGFNCGVGGTNVWSAHITGAIGTAVRESAETGGFVFRCAAGQGISADNDQVGSGSIKMNIRYVVED